MKVRIVILKSACVLWGFVYLVTGWLESWSFTSNDVDSLLVLLTLFVFPLPIAILAIRRPRSAGRTLLTCTALTFAGGPTFALRGATTIASYSMMLGHLGAYSIPRSFRHRLFDIPDAISRRVNQRNVFVEEM